MKTHNSLLIQYSVVFIFCMINPIARGTSTHANRTSITPEQKIERVIDQCIFDRTNKRSFTSFVDELLAIINQNRTYFITKIPEPILDAMYNDFNAIKRTNNYTTVISILIKYREYKKLVPPEARKKFSAVVALLGLKRRLSPPQKLTRENSHLVDPFRQSMPL